MTSLTLVNSAEIRTEDGLWSKHLNRHPHPVSIDSTLIQRLHAARAPYAAFHTWLSQLEIDTYRVRFLWMCSTFTI